MEVGFALAAAFTLVIGAAVMFSYFSSRMLLRQEAYESDSATGRAAAASPYNSAVVVVDENAQLPKLDIFGTGG